MRLRAKSAHHFADMSNEDMSRDFHPEVLIVVAQDQALDLAWLPAALASCGNGEWESPAYVAYVSRSKPNQPGSEWQFKTSVVLDHETLGKVVIDILKGDRIGGIELVNRIEL